MSESDFSFEYETINLFFLSFFIYLSIHSLFIHLDNFSNKLIQIFKTKGGFKGQSIKNTMVINELIKTNDKVYCVIVM